MLTLPNIGGEKNSKIFYHPELGISVEVVNGAPLRVNFTVSDETSTSFISALDYLKRGKRLNPMTHWDTQVTGWGGKLRVPPSSTSHGCPVRATALLRSIYVIVRLLALLSSSCIVTLRLVCMC